MSTEENFAIAHRFVSALEAFDAEALRQVFADDAEQIEWPNRLKPDGDRRKGAEIWDAAANGAAVLKSQNYDVLNQFASGDLLVLEFTWTGVLAVSIGSLSAGDTMRAHCTAVMELEAGRIRRLRNYDCFEAF